MKNLCKNSCFFDIKGCLGEKKRLDERYGQKIVPLPEFLKNCMKKKTKNKGTATLRQTKGPRTSNIIWAILSGGLLSAAWPTWGMAPVIFIAFVPLLLLEGRIAEGERGRMLWLSFLTFLVWNVATTWWVWNATPAATAGGQKR